MKTITALELVGLASEDNPVLVDAVSIESLSGNDRDISEMQYQLCIGGEAETTDCVRIDFESFPSYGVSPDLILELAE